MHDRPRKDPPGAFAEQSGNPFGVLTLLLRAQDERAATTERFDLCGDLFHPARSEQDALRQSFVDEWL
jgi:hypothetical protein